MKLRVAALLWDWIVSATRAIRGGPSNSQGLPAEYWSGQVRCSSHSYHVLCPAAREYRGGGRRVAGCRGSGQLANRRLGGLVIR